LLDEVEKAHPDVFNILLQMLEDGRVTDSQGRHVDFRNVIVIMTSNIGAGMITKNVSLGFSMGHDDAGMSHDDMKGKVMGELKKHFRPELLNRIDEVIVFHKLTKEEIREITDLLMRRLHNQMAEHELKLELTESAFELLQEEGYDPTLGARPMKRAIQRLVEDHLADAMLGKAPVPGSTLVVDRSKDDPKQTSIKVKAPRKSRAKKEPEPATVAAGDEAGEDVAEPSSE
ncbi:MAG: AAA family ATPase, partial [Thermoleophilia bacterium]|nr:AAA family ATPase [Thermoleophilia bacterium]